MTSSIIYQGTLRCQATHVQSGSIIETDAPTDNRGKGERFSPTDLLCVSLATCIITTMGIKATDMGVNIEGTETQVTKHMLAEPRRVGSIDVHISLTAAGLDEKSKLILQRAGDHCPVKKSLHPDLITNIEYKWQ